MNDNPLPTINAVFNIVSIVMLLLGYIQIKKGDRDLHQRYMITALIVSAAFLTTYVIYHATAGSVPYPHYDWTRTLYFAILIPHIILAAVMVPFILAIVWFAFRQSFDRHRRLARWVWPVWMFVSVSGVVVYVMLYRL